MSGIALGLGLDEHYFRRALLPRPADPVSHLQLSLREPAGTWRPSALGRRRAHRLRPAHDPAAGRHRRAAGEIALPLDRRAADPRLVPLQHRRHARAPDARHLPLDAASRPQHVSRATGCRSRSSSIRASTPGCRPSRARGPRAPLTMPASDGTAPACTNSRAPTATICSARSPRCFRSSAGEVL